MTLLKLMEVLDENQSVYVFNPLTGDVITYYDGKNSIDPQYNDRKVIKVRGCNDAIQVDLEV